LFQFIPHYFEGQYTSPGAGPGNFAWHGMHLWYLLFLFMYTLLLMALFWWCRSQAGSRALRRMGDLQALPGALLLLVPTVVLQHVTASGALLGNIDLGGFLLESQTRVQKGHLALPGSDLRVDGRTGDVRDHRLALNRQRSHR
jgi:hypothetical protein